jgi:hypothetical protein
MIEALRIIAARSPYAGSQAMQCIKAIQVESPIVNERYNRVVELAFSDPQAEFTPEERQLIAGFINEGDGKRSETVRFRVTAAEQASLEDKANDASMNVSDYIRSLIWPE